MTRRNIAGHMRKRAGKWLKTKQGRKFIKYWGGRQAITSGWGGGVGMVEWVAMVLDVGDDIKALKANEMIRRIDDAGTILLHAGILGFDFAAYGNFEP